MFLYRVKVDDLDAARIVALKSDLERSAPGLRAQCPIREMSVVSDRGLDIYLALDDVIGAAQLKRLADELNAMIASPHITSELIHI